jgi:hypothetical protein
MLGEPVYETSSRDLKHEDYVLNDSIVGDIGEDEINVILEEFKKADENNKRYIYT